MAVVRLKIKKNHLNNCMTNALQFKDLNMNSNLRYSRLRHKFEINQKKTDKALFKYFLKTQSNI